MSEELARRLDSLGLMAGLGACYIRDSDDTEAAEPAEPDGTTGASETETREAARLATLARYPVGSVWRYMGQIRHVLAVIDDTQLVYRFWDKHRSRWMYGIEYWYMLWLAMQEKAR